MLATKCASTTFNLIKPSEILATAQVIPVDCFGNANGEVSLNLSGGTGSFNTNWSGPNGFSSVDNNLIGIDTGSYSLNIIDSLGCTKDTLIVISQPDLGTAILIALSGLVVVWLAGLNIKYFIYSFIALIISLPFAIAFLKPYQKIRVLTFIDPDRDPLGAGYQIIQSKIAVGSGGLFGKGFLKGTQSYLEFLPEKHTDFIFTLYSEEFGFIGSAFLLLIYAIIIYRILAIGATSRSYFAKLFCYSFGAAIFVYITINMSMVLGLLPIVGSPLPIMSYGGSSMLATMIGFGIVMSARVHSQQSIA